MKKLVLLVMVVFFSFFLVSGLSIEGSSSKESVDKVFETDKGVVQIESVAVEQANIISDMRCEVDDLLHMTCQITRMLKSTGDKDVRRECKPRVSNHQSTCRSGGTHGGGDVYHLTTTTER
jgi:hypothetical protein